MQHEKKYRKMVKASAMLLVVMFGYLNFEPAIADAVSTSVNVSQAVTTEISISKSGDVTMSPSIAGMTGGSATGSTTITVKTNNLAGFSMAIKAGTNPALESAEGNSFADYTPVSTPTPDFAWDVASADSEFGYSIEAATLADNVTPFLDNGTACGGSGAAQAADKCWAGLSTSNFTVVNRANPTLIAGEAEVVKLKAEAGATHFQNQGSYTATLTLTATAN
jgi:hypothetical protein